MPATESYLRDVKKVHVVFALTSILLLAVTLWMIAADHAREWHGYERTFDEIQAKKQQLAIESIEKSPQYEKSKAELEEEQKAAAQQLQSIEPELKKLTKELEDAERIFDLAGRRVRIVRSYRDKARADFDLGVRDNLDKQKLDALQSDFNAKQAVVDAAELDVQQKQTKRDAIQTKVKDLTKAHDDATVGLTKLNSDLELRDKALAKLDPQGLFGFQEADHGMARDRRLQLAAQDHAGLAPQFDDPARHGPHGPFRPLPHVPRRRSTGSRRATSPVFRSDIREQRTSPNGCCRTSSRIRTPRIPGPSCT